MEPKQPQVETSATKASNHCQLKGQQSLQNGVSCQQNSNHLNKLWDNGEYGRNARKKTKLSSSEEQPKSAFATPSRSSRGSEDLTQDFKRVMLEQFSAMAEQLGAISKRYESLERKIETLATGNITAKPSAIKVPLVLEEGQMGPPLGDEPTKTGNVKRFQSNSSTATFYLSNYAEDVSVLKPLLKLYKLDCTEFIKISKDGERSLHRLKFSHLVRPSKIMSQFPHLEFSDKSFAERELLVKTMKYATRQPKSLEDQKHTREVLCGNGGMQDHATIRRQLYFLQASNCVSNPPESDVE